MDLITVYVSKSAETNLQHGLLNGVWGFVDGSKPNFELVEGSYLLLGNGFTGGSPRVDFDRWRDANLSNAFLARITSPLYESAEVEFPNEGAMDPTARYVWRFRFELLNEFHDVDLGALPFEVSDGLRRSAISQSRPNLAKGVDIGALQQILSGNVPPPDPTATRNDDAQIMTDHPYKSILLSIKTKPFILLAGISGTGKSRLVRTLAYLTCAKEELRTDPKKPGNFELIPVRPNWHDSDELVGYVSRINGEKFILTPFLRFLAKAWRHPDIPFFLCLDEMNLAPVEQYFAEYLSVIETRANNGGILATDYLISKDQFENKELYSKLLDELNLLDDQRFEDGVGIPGNLVVAGTVNMDETTHSFSRKVLDRGMTYEMNFVDLHSGLDGVAHAWKYPSEFIPFGDVIGTFSEGREVVGQFSESKDVLKYLQDINAILDGSPFKIAYRVRDEFLIYCFYARRLNAESSNWLDNALDAMTSMKILSRIEGDEVKTREILVNLDAHLGPNFQKSKAKIFEMRTRLENTGYTSFWS
jgi:energy-coupling factor transporter ATP-binding protein EcfA2